MEKNNIDMNGFRIFALPLPNGQQQPATKGYVDQKTHNKILLLIVKQKKMKYFFLTVLKV